MDSQIEDKENENIILNKINNLEKKILNFLNVKLSLELTGKEIKLDLNNKNIGNVELQLLTGINFENLEELNLSKNNISDIKLLKQFNLDKLKKIDLSFNKINELNGSKNNFEIKLKNNDCMDISKDIEEIKKLINNFESNLESNNKNELTNYNDVFLTKSYYNINAKTKKQNNKKELLNKIELTEKKILNYFNSKLNVNLTGKEIKLWKRNKIKFK